MNWAETILLATAVLAIIGAIGCVRFIWPAFLALIIAIIEPWAGLVFVVIVGALFVAVFAWEFFLAPLLVSAIQWAFSEKETEKP